LSAKKHSVIAGFCTDSHKFGFTNAGQKCLIEQTLGQTRRQQQVTKERRKKIE
jgi:hypothetical protein